MKTSPLIRLARYLMIASLLLSACGSLVNAQPERLVVVWHSLSGEREHAFLKLVDRWNKINTEGIIVSPERRTGGALSALPTPSAASAQPGLLLVPPAQAALYDQSNLLVDFRSLANSDPAHSLTAQDPSPIYPFVMAAGERPGGRWIGLPFGGQIRVVFYNRDWLKQINIDGLPATWEAFNSACAGATDRIRNTVCFSVSPNPIVYEEWTMAHDGKFVSADGTLLQINDPANEAALERLWGFVQSFQAAQVGAETQGRDDFTNARALLSFGWSDEIPTYRALIRARANFDWDIATLPIGEQTQGGVPYHSLLWVIPKSNTAREVGAWSFVRWLMDTEQSVEWSQATGDLPARSAAANQLIAQSSADPAFVSTLLRAAPHAQTQSVIAQWPCIESEISPIVREIFTGRPITAALQSAQTEGQARLGEPCLLRGPEFVR